MLAASANFPATLPAESGRWHIRPPDSSRSLLARPDAWTDHRGQRNSLRFTLEGELLLDSGSFQWIDGDRLPQTYDVTPETETIEGMTFAARSAIAAYQGQIAMGKAAANAQPGRAIDDYV